MIESRYTIEYINPESAGKTTTKKNIFLFVALGLILIAAITYAFISIKKSNDFVRLPKKSQESAIVVAGNDGATNNKLFPSSIKTVISKQPDITDQNINEPLQQKKKQSSKSSKQVTANKKLNKSINSLTQQLMAERDKNKTLNKRLYSQKSENNQLSGLLEKALSKASKADKSYLSALSQLDKKTKKNNAITKQKSIKTNQVSSKVEVAVVDKQTLEKADHNNSISLSTNRQVDAIIAAMQSNNSFKVIKTNVDKTQEVQLASIRQAHPTELLHVQLQKKINQLLNKNAKLTTTNTYKKALEKESNVRQNAMRSITIKKGETLWAIAKRAYGNGNDYKKIVKANPQINIEKLYVGQVVRVPM